MPCEKRQRGDGSAGGSRDVHCTASSFYILAAPSLRGGMPARKQRHSMRQTAYGGSLVRKSHTCYLTTMSSCRDGHSLICKRNELQR